MRLVIFLKQQAIDVLVNIKQLILLMLIWFLPLASYAQKEIVLREKTHPKCKKNTNVKSYCFEKADIFFIIKDSTVCLPEIAPLRYEISKELLDFMSLDSLQSIKIVILSKKIAIIDSFKSTYFKLFSKKIDYSFFNIRRSSKGKYIQMNAVNSRGYIVNGTAFLVPKREYKYLKKKCK